MQDLSGAHAVGRSVDLPGALTREVVATTGAPRAVGPYSQAIRAGATVFTCGVIGLDPATGALVAGGVATETERALTNLEAILDAGGSSMARVVKTTIFLVEMADFEPMNAVYGTFFRDDPPARSTVAVAALPRGARVEIEAVALIRD